MIKENTAPASNLNHEPKPSKPKADTTSEKLDKDNSEHTIIKSLYEQLDYPLLVVRKTLNQSLNRNRSSTQIYPENALLHLTPKHRLIVVNILNTLATKVKDITKPVNFFNKQYQQSFQGVIHRNNIIIVVFNGDTTNIHRQQILNILHNQNLLDKTPLQFKPILNSTDLDLLIEKIHTALATSDTRTQNYSLIASYIACVYKVDQAIIATAVGTRKLKIQGISEKKEFLSDAPYILELEHKLNTAQSSAQSSAQEENRLISVNHVALGRCACVLILNNDSSANRLSLHDTIKYTDQLHSQLDNLTQQITWPLLHNVLTHENVLQKIVILCQPKFLKKLSRLKNNNRTKIKCCLALFFFLTLFVPIDYQVSAKALIEGKIQQALVAPIDGYLISSYARAGDIVEKNSLIAQIDDNDLQLELSRLINLKAEHEKTYRRELAEFNQSEARIARSKTEQAQAEIDLIEQQLKRTQLIAPFDGVILKGDFSQSHGAPVTKGDVLFEVSPSDEYTLILLINESEIRHIDIGQFGNLHLKSQPDSPQSFTVNKIAAIAQTSDTKVTYRIKAKLNQSDISNTKITPGMEGIGKVYVGKKTIAWIFFHRPITWLRFKLWWLLP